MMTTIGWCVGALAWFGGGLLAAGFLNAGLRLTAMEFRRTQRKFLRMGIACPGDKHIYREWIRRDFAFALGVGLIFGPLAILAALWGPDWGASGLPTWHLSMKPTKQELKEELMACLERSVEKRSTTK